VVDVVHLNSVSDLLFVKLCAAAENINILVVENAASGRVTSNIQISDPAPSIILDIVLLARRVKTLCVIASNHKNKTTFAVERCEVGPFK